MYDYILMKCWKNEKKMKMKKQNNLQHKGKMTKKKEGHKTDTLDPK
jgi:hypothetical protein